jgi:gliding motility-associated protein GldC
MKKSDINIEVSLDEQNVPEKISWNATDLLTEGTQEVKALSLSFWDGSEQGTLKMDLWTKEMEVLEMKRFAIEIVSGLASMIRNATSDEIMAMEMENMCDGLAKRLEQEIKSGQ